jgi:hypothetical protein
MRTHECLPRLTAIGISYQDAIELRRIAMTLHRWHELECGDNYGCVERDETTGKPYWRSSDGRLSKHPIADREKGARKRLGAVMKRYPELTAYVQTDPRGASLYILQPQDIPEGADVDSYYSRGVAVYK